MFSWTVRSTRSPFIAPRLISVLFLQHLFFPMVSSRKPGYFLCKFRLPATDSRQGSLALAGGQSSSPDQPASVFSASSLSGPVGNPAGRKTIGLRYRTTGGKKRNLNLCRHERNEQNRKHDGRGRNSPGQEIQIHAVGAAAIGLRVVPRLR